MTSVEFVLWLAGAVDLVGEDPPSPAQWAQIREKAGSAIGKLAADRILERAAKIESDTGINQLYGAAVLQQYQQRVADYAYQVDTTAEKFAAPSGIFGSLGAALKSGLIAK
jgi:hypothetical protein